jgi:hypothetical protein
MNTAHSVGSKIGGIGRDVPIPSGLEDPVGFADAPTLAAKDDRPAAKKTLPR